MASWMIHLRIADTLLDQIGNLSAEEFIMGNIAPKLLPLPQAHNGVFRRLCNGSSSEVKGGGGRQ